MDRRTFLTQTTGGLLSLTGGSLLASCGMQSLSTPAATKPFTIALVVGMDAIPFYTAVKTGAVDQAKKLGMTLLYDGPKSFSAQEQIPIVNALIAKKPDAIIVAPCDKDALAAPMKTAHDQGIAVLTVDTFLGNGDYTKGELSYLLSHVGSDNYQGGVIQAQAVIKAIGGTGKIYLQANSPGTGSTADRERGFKDTVAAAVLQSRNALTLVATQYDNGSAQKATEQTAAILQRYPDLAAIAGTDNFASAGAVQAIKNSNKQGVQVAYFDTGEGAIIDLRNKLVSLVVAQKPALMGSTAVDFAVKALSGETVPKREVTDYFVIDAKNVDTPEAQAVIYH